MSINTGLNLKNKFARQKKKCIDITGTSSMLMKYFFEVQVQIFLQVIIIQASLSIFLSFCLLMS